VEPPTLDELPPEAESAPLIVAIGECENMQGRMRLWQEKLVTLHPHVIWLGATAEVAEKIE
jgi:hypothetical protein